MGRTGEGNKTDQRSNEDSRKREEEEEEKGRAQSGETKLKVTAERVGRDKVQRETEMALRGTV